MQNFTSQEFNIPELKGISAKNIEEHLKLYKGYVTNANAILGHIATYQNNPEFDYLLKETHRRFSFEWNGMNNHEHYFGALEGGAQEINTGGDLYKKITEDFGGFDQWLTSFKSLALTRGVGWAMLYFDYNHDTLLNVWVDEQHMGQLSEAKIILALDMWEHAYVYDYPTSEKKKYIDAFFENLNWSVIEENFKKTV